MGREQQFLHFRSALGNRLVAVSDIVEVIPMVALQQDGETVGPGYCGLLSYRGHIVPVFALVPAAADSGGSISIEHFLIVTKSRLESGAAMVAIVAHEVDALVAVEDEHIVHVNPLEGRAFTAARVNDELLRVVRPAEFLR